MEGNEVAVHDWIGGFSGLLGSPVRTLRFQQRSDKLVEKYLCRYGFIYRSVASALEKKVAVRRIETLLISHEICIST